MVSRRMSLALIALVAACVLSLQARAQNAPLPNLQPVSVIVFPGGFNLPIWIAQEKGFFTRGGIEVKLTNTPNSVFQMTNLIDKKFDIAITAIDNVIAYNENQGEGATTFRADLVAFMGGDNGFLSLVSVPEVKSVAELKGRKVSVDALTTGYAFVLLDLLKRGGLKKDDYKVEKAGGVLGRYEALRDKKHDATILITPFEIMAQAGGSNVLASAIDVYKNYQGLVGAARRDWVQANPGLVESYIRGTVAGVDYLRDTKNKAEVIAILRKNLPQMSPEVAEQSYAVLAGPKGFTPKAKLDLRGVNRVLALRAEYGESKKKLRNPGRYINEKIYKQAMRIRD